MGASASVDNVRSFFNHDNYQNGLRNILELRENQREESCYDVLITGHDETNDLIDFFQVILHHRTNPKLRSTRDVNKLGLSRALLVVMSPNSWSSEAIISALNDAIEHSKRIVFVHLPLNDSYYSHDSSVFLKNRINLEVDLSRLLSTVPKQFAFLFEEIEVISLRYEAWVIDSVNSHIIESLGYIRRLDSSAACLFFPFSSYTSKRKNITTQRSSFPDKIEDFYLKEQLYEGYAFDKRRDTLLGWYQILSSPNEDQTVKFSVQYLSQSVTSIPSFSYTHEMHWKEADGTWTVKQIEGDWYTDDRWESSQGNEGYGSLNTSNYTLELANEYSSGGASIHVSDQTVLYRCSFLYHFCLLGVINEIADTAATFANVIYERALQSRKPKIVTLCSAEYENLDNNHQEEFLLKSATIVVFITPSIWTDAKVLHQLKLAKENNIPIILISQSDPRLIGHCNIPEVMKSAPEDLQQLDVLPFYRRSYEQNALLDYVLLQAGFIEAIPIDLTLQDMWKASSLDFSLMETKLLSYIDNWDDTNEIDILEKGNWIYYEGTAQRGGTVWGRYQLDGIFHDERKEFILLINFQSENPRSFPSYMKVTTFDWNPEVSQFRENTPDGHWIGVRDTDSRDLITRNKFNDTITHKAMPFVYHFFLSHIQRECTDLCAFVTSELIKMSKVGKKIRCWFDQKASQINKASMYNGIKYSGAYVLFLSSSIWKSIYVMFELSIAKQLQKPIILIYNTNKQSKSYINLDDLMEQAPNEHKNLLQECNELIHFHSVGIERNLFIRKLVLACGYHENLQDDNH